jgi:hypothetical protein
MATVYLLGAGASHGYGDSPTGVAPPLASGLFAAYSALRISEDLGVKVGWLINYVRDVYGLPQEQFGTFRMDAEAFMTSVEDAIERFFRRVKSGAPLEPLEFATGARTVAVYDQTLFLFTHILNEIANGPIYGDYARLVKSLGPDDTLVTFNWDTLLDRALFEFSDWTPDDGYMIQFNSIYDEAWRPPEPPRAHARYLLKLHGSTNWLTRYISRDLQTGVRSMSVYDAAKTGVSFNVETDKSVDDVLERGSAHLEPHMEMHHVATKPLEPSMLRPLCFVKGEGRFDTFRNRFREGYGPFTYFYSPLDPDEGIVTSPLIVAPVKNKGYEEFDSILGPLWNQAAKRIESADCIRCVGFSFPETDVRIRGLFFPVAHRRTIEIVDPFPERAATVLGKLTESTPVVIASSLSELVGRD